jgi:hypothetical protein
VNWDQLKVGVNATDYMYTMTCSGGGKFAKGHLIPFGNIELSPFAGVLNYGQVCVFACTHPAISVNIYTYIVDSFHKQRWLSLEVW